MAHNGSDNGATRIAAVTGASGFVGRHMIRALLDADFHVRALCRDGEKAGRVLPTEAVEDGRLTLILGDALDNNRLDTLVHGADVCINLIGIIRETGNGQTFERMHVETTRSLLRACEAAGVRRYLQMSALGVANNAETAYGRTKFEAEQAVRVSHLAWTIFRPALIHGPGGEFTGMMVDWARGQKAPWFFIPYFTRLRAEGESGAPLKAPIVAPVHVDDVCRAFVTSIDHEIAEGEVYPLVGAEELSFPAMLEHVRDRVKLGRRGLATIGIPGRAAAAKARVMHAIGLGSLMPFDEGMAIMGSQDNHAATHKTADHLDIHPAGFRDRFAEYSQSL